MLYFFILTKNNEFCDQIWDFSKYDFNEKNHCLLIYNKTANYRLKFILNEEVDLCG
jgi:hypothetical protein